MNPVQPTKTSAPSYRLGIWAPPGGVSHARGCGFGGGYPRDWKVKMPWLNFCDLLKTWTTDCLVRWCVFLKHLYPKKLQVFFIPCHWNFFFVSSFFVKTCPLRRRMKLSQMIPLRPAEKRSWFFLQILHLRNRRKWVSYIFHTKWQRPKSLVNWLAFFLTFFETRSFPFVVFWTILYTWGVYNFFHTTYPIYPIGSMGRTVYIPTIA